MANEILVDRKTWICRLMRHVECRLGFSCECKCHEKDNLKALDRLREFRQMRGGS